MLQLFGLCYKSINLCSTSAMCKKTWPLLFLPGFIVRITVEMRKGMRKTRNERVAVKRKLLLMTDQILHRSSMATRWDSAYSMCPWKGNSCQHSLLYMIQWFIWMFLLQCDLFSLSWPNLIIIQDQANVIFWSVHMRKTKVLSFFRWCMKMEDMIWSG